MRSTVRGLSFPAVVKPGSLLLSGSCAGPRDEPSLQRQCTPCNTSHGANHLLIRDCDGLATALDDFHCMAAGPPAPAVLPALPLIMTLGRKTAGCFGREAAASKQRLAPLLQNLLLASRPGIVWPLLSLQPTAVSECVGWKTACVPMGCLQAPPWRLPMSAN